MDGQAGTRSERKQQTRLLLIETAHDLMAERGIIATRTIDVAERAGVAHGTVFVHFATREDLIAAVVGVYAGRIAKRLHELAGEETTVRAVLTAHLAGLAEDEAFYSRLVMEGPLLPPYARATLLGMQSAISAHLAEVAEQEMAAGEVRRMPISLLFNTWLGLVHHYVGGRELFAPGQSVVKRWGPTLLDHYLGLLRPDGQGGEV
ncbi:fatty acid metabolism regulator protein [bacterium BMS3Abin02]|nr:fatty acid metabolism regulator protein [bacterium BMS3Abin02]